MSDTLECGLGYEMLISFISLDECIFIIQAFCNLIFKL